MDNQRQFRLFLSSDYKANFHYIEELAAFVTDHRWRTKSVDEWHKIILNMKSCFKSWMFFNFESYPSRSHHSVFELMWNENQQESMKHVLLTKHTFQANHARHVELWMSNILTRQKTWCQCCCEVSKSMEASQINNAFPLLARTCVRWEAFIVILGTAV